MSELLLIIKSGEMLTQSKRILLFGLPVVGKTTICQWLVEGLTDIREADFHATIDYNKYTQSINDTQIVFFDFGGATAFLNRFTGELGELIFTGATCLIFLVDSIEPISTPRAKYYLDLCVKNIEHYSPKTSVFIFQHKIDLVPKN